MTRRGLADGYLGRLLDVITAVGASDDGLTLTELSRQLELPLSTASRLTALLIEREFIERQAESGRLLPGAGLKLLGLRSLRRARADVEMEAGLDKLAKATNESVSLGRVTQGQLVLTSRRESSHQLRAVAQVGDLLPVHMTAMGKAVLAYLPADERLALLRSDLSDAESVYSRLEPELERVRQHGYAEDDEEFQIGLRCVAAPFFDGTGRPIGGVSVSGPTARFTAARAQAVAPVLIEATHAITRALEDDA